AAERRLVAEHSIEPLELDVEREDSARGPRELAAWARARDVEPARCGAKRRCSAGSHERERAAFLVVGEWAKVVPAVRAHDGIEGEVRGKLERETQRSEQAVDYAAGFFSSSLASSGT